MHLAASICLATVQRDALHMIVLHELHSLLQAIGRSVQFLILAAALFCCCACWINTTGGTAAQKAAAFGLLLEASVLVHGWERE